MPLFVQPIVEGHGEYAAIRGTLERVWYDLLQFTHDPIQILRPFRRSQGLLLKPESLTEAVQKSVSLLRENDAPDARHLVLILIDAESHCPKDLGPRLLAVGRAAWAGADVACVLPNPMFETWFVAAAGSLVAAGLLPPGTPPPADPEGSRLGKPWIKRHRKPYSETLDQPRFAAKFDPAECRAKSASFDKLCRELERRAPPPAGDATP